ncbi:MAG: permease [Rhodospirillales bacterium]|nr:permease [Alphaproteobacteria bacterium]USO06372.1 MAG: permease [Rhodospirillales bacterium]
MKIFSLLLPTFSRNRKLGVGERKGGYDLPLHKSAGSHFLVLLVGLMSFLAMMALSATMVLGGVTRHWSSGLKNKVTIEIPAQKPGGVLRSAVEIKELGLSVEALLTANPNIKALHILEKNDIHGLVSPWLGDDVVLDELPLPGLVSAELHVRNKDKLESIEKALAEIAGDIRLDTHESWLEDILRLAGTLKLSALIVTLIIGATTIVAIAGAIRSRMAEHKADIELLHLMGASDLYITKQLQRHAVVLTLKGALIGVLSGLMILLMLSAFGGSGEGATIPSMHLSTSQIIILLLLPGLIALIASQTARVTVLRVLGQMP